RREQRLPFIGQSQTAWHPAKQRDPQRRLQRFDQMAHGRLGDAKLETGAREAQMPRRSLESAQCVQRQMRFAHVPTKKGFVAPINHTFSSAAPKIWSFVGRLAPLHVARTSTG